MEPAIIGGSWVISFRLGFRRRVPVRFDVVRLEDPKMSGHWILKRIVGLPGEQVLLKDGELFIDGQSIADTYAHYAQISSDKFEWWPTNDEYVVLGDNRLFSTDSRKFGPIKRSAIRGRVKINQST